LWTLALSRQERVAIAAVYAQFMDLCARRGLGSLALVTDVAVRKLYVRETTTAAVSLPRHGAVEVYDLGAFKAVISNNKNGSGQSHLVEHVNRILEGLSRRGEPFVDQ
jgi:hypothetical protein